MGNWPAAERLPSVEARPSDIFRELAMEMRIAPAQPGDLPEAIALLAAAQLPSAGVADYFSEFLVARGDGALAGAVGLETYGTNALLRSLVVAPGRRGSGLGAALTERIIAQARERGVRRLYLLTETAPRFFPRFGFRVIAREEAAADVGHSAEFQGACPQTALCMVLDLS
jgi:amino-acid N-acetyltransferase